MKVGNDYRMPVRACPSRGGAPRPCAGLGAGRGLGKMGKTPWYRCSFTVTCRWAQHNEGIFCIHPGADRNRFVTQNFGVGIHASKRLNKA